MADRFKLYTCSDYESDSEPEPVVAYSPGAWREGGNRLRQIGLCIGVWYGSAILLESEQVSVRCERLRLYWVQCTTL